MSPSSVRTRTREVVLAPGTARRRALDDALAEIEAGVKAPSAPWRVHYALMLGLERVLSGSRRPSRRAPSCAATRSTLSRAC